MADRWHMVKDPERMRQEINRAAQAKDPDQRQAALIIANFIRGDDINPLVVARAQWALGCLYDIVWGNFNQDE